MQERHRQTVAVVEDDDAVRDSLRFLLEAAGFNVVTFNSAAAFLSGADLDGLACVLIDQHMPQTTGLELLRRVRARDRDLPVALMTGSPSPALTRRAVELGVSEMLEKPLDEDVLLAFVTRAVG